jgi:hypothetical protein
MTNNDKQVYTFPELMKKYFPDHPIETEAVVEDVLTREDFMDILMKVSRPQQALPPDKEMPKSSE